MKRLATLIFFIIIFLSISNINLHANDNIALPLIICEEGIANFSDLDDTNAYTYSGNINFNAEGKYKISYLLKNNENVNRDVIITKKENLEKGIAYTNYKNSIDMNKYGASFGNIVYIDDNSYYSYINEENNNNYHASIYYNYQDEVIAYNIFDSIRIVDIYIFQNQTYVLYQYKESGFSKIGLMLINNNCDEIRNMRYESNKQEEAIKLITLNNNLYILFNTTSNIGIVERGSSFQVAAMIKVNPLSLRKESVSIIANDNESKFIDVCNDYDNPYFLISFSGTKGSYYNSYNKSYTGKMILSYDKSPYVLASIPTSFENDQVIFSKTGFFLINKYLNNIDISFNSYYNINSSYSKTILLDNNITSYFIFSYNDQLIIIENEDNIISSIVEINSSSINHLSFYDITYKIDNVKIVDDKIYLMAYNGNIYIYGFHIYKINKNISYSTYQSNHKIEYEDIKIIDNNSIIQSNNKCRNDNEIYGKYDIKMYCEADNIKIIASSYHIIPLICNVSSDEVYDLNLVLSFNGIAYLNNEAINNNYIIEEVGNYQLDIIGINQTKQSFNFEVRDKCLKEKSKYFKKVEDNQYEYMQYNEEKNYLSNNNYEIMLYDKKENFKYAIIFILIFSLSFFSFLLFKKRGTKK